MHRNLSNVGLSAVRPVSGDTCDGGLCSMASLRCESLWAQRVSAQISDIGRILGRRGGELALFTVPSGRGWVPLFVGQIPLFVERGPAPHFPGSPFCSAGFPFPGAWSFFSGADPPFSWALTPSEIVGPTFAFPGPSSPLSCVSPFSLPSSSFSGPGSPFPVAPLPGPPAGAGSPVDFHVFQPSGEQ